MRKPRARKLAAAALAATALLLGPVMAAEVSPGHSIQAALDAAGPGATVTVKPGTYAEHVRITKDGIKLLAEKGAVLDVRRTFAEGWTRAMDWDPKGRVWSARLPFRPGRAYWKGKMFEGINPAVMSGAASGWADAARQKCTGQELMRLEKDDYYWAGGEAVWGYRNEDSRTVYVRVADAEAFAPQDFSFASEEPVILIEGPVSGVTVSGFQILGATSGSASAKARPDASWRTTSSPAAATASH